MKYILLLITCLVFINCRQQEVKKIQDAEEPASEASVTYVDVPFAKGLIMRQDNLVILDVRTQKEADDGIIENAIVIDVKSEDYVDKINELDKSLTYLVYCRSGNRSIKATDLMLESGFEDVYMLEGGYLDWVDSN